jgi:hypothetical protein
MLVCVVCWRVVVLRSDHTPTDQRSHDKPAACEYPGCTNPQTMTFGTDFTPVCDRHSGWHTMDKDRVLDGLFGPAVEPEQATHCEHGTYLHDDHCLACGDSGWDDEAARVRCGECQEPYTRVELDESVTDMRGRR